MGFAKAHEQWLAEHLRRRKGERRGRLERGHGHGERMFLKRVWWPTFGHLDDLHPEYEVLDWRGKPYFIDFAWLKGHCKFAFEIKGFGPHVQEADRIGYRRELDRETFLQVLGFRVISIPYDNLQENPKLTIHLIKSLLSPYMTVRMQDQAYSRWEREVLLIAFRSNKPIRPIDVANDLQMNQRTAVRYLQALSGKGKLRPVSSGKGIRIVRYEFVHTLSDDWMW